MVSMKTSTSSPFSQFLYFHKVFPKDVVVYCCECSSDCKNQQTDFSLCPQSIPCCCVYCISFWSLQTEKLSLMCLNFVQFFYRTCKNLFSVLTTFFNAPSRPICHLSDDIDNIENFCRSLLVRLTKKSFLVVTSARRFCHKLSNNAVRRSAPSDPTQHCVAY